MASDPYFCGSPTRRTKVREARDGNDRPFLNGIDYLEVDPSDQRLLHVHFIHPLPGETDGVPASPPLEVTNFRIDGGVRVTAVQVESVAARDGAVISLRTDRTGDFSEYVLHLVTSVTDAGAPAGFDPVLARVPFSFKVNCPRDTDCREDRGCVEPPAPAPYLNYLAKDYASFRQLMLDRLSTTLPEWRERNPADVGVALVEVLAYAADHLSYYQDAVATEAYLGTARRRTSVRRHARLVDYHLHDGCNARAWLVFETAEDRGTPAAPAIPRSTRVAAMSRDRSSPEVVFETLHTLTTLLVARNEIRIHTWGESTCCLPKGATSAVLDGTVASLGLQRGDVLLFEEVLGVPGGRAEEADRTHRHAVRLSEPPRDRQDPLTGTPLVEVRWHDADALPFPLRLDTFDDGEGLVRAAAVARGNVVLADHGETKVPLETEASLVPPRAPASGAYRPTLAAPNLTFVQPYDDAAARERPAAEAFTSDPRRGVPAIVLTAGGETWRPRRDLLSSNRFAAEFVVEREEDGYARIRFGDGILGRAPAAGTQFRARYRVGGGAAGNVGAEALTHLIADLSGVKVRNPLPASGGTDPEPVRDARLYAPHAFRTLRRAVTEADYADAAERHPEVQRAAASRRWTGSWHTMFITVDRRNGRPIDTAFEQELRRFLEPFRMAGYDIEIDAPRYVPLDIALRICVAPGAYRAAVRTALHDLFGAGAHPDGTLGFFHPDNFTFGQPVVLSAVRSRALDVPGVQDVLEVVRFGRYGDAPRGEIDRGFIPMHRLEIARLDNDPSARERGRIEFLLEGGL